MYSILYSADKLAGELQPLLGDLDTSVAPLGQLRPHAPKLVPEAAVLQDSGDRRPVPAHLVHISVDKLFIQRPLDLGITLS